MTVTVGGTTITFNDSTTQTTAPVNTNANVNSITAGTGISVSSTTGAVTITNTNTSSGTVTSVATGNGLSGGTITSSGTLVLAAPSYNSVGSYCNGVLSSGTAIGNSNYAAGSGASQMQGFNINECGQATKTNNFSGTWRAMCGSSGVATNSPGGTLFVRVS